MRNLFWLDDTAWSVIEPLLLKNQSGARRVDENKLTRTFLDAITIAAIYAFWL